MALYLYVGCDMEASLHEGDISQLAAQKCLANTKWFSKTPS